MRIFWVTNKAKDKAVAVQAAGPCFFLSTGPFFFAYRMIIMNSTYVKLAIGLALLLLLSGSLFWLFRQWLPAYLGKRIKQEVNRRSQNLYTLNYQMLQLAPLAGNISLKGVQLKADSSHGAYQQKATLQVKVNEVRLRGLQALTWLRHKQIRLDTLEIHRPVVTLHQPPGKAAPGASDKSQKPQSQGRHGRFSLQALDIRDASFTWFKGNREFLGLDHAVLSGSAFRWRSGDALPEYHSFKAALKGLHVPLANKLDSLDIGYIAINSADSTLQLQELRLQPLYKRIRYSEEYGARKARKEVEIERITLQKLDFDSLLNERKLVASQLMIDSLSLFAFKDKRKPLKPGTQKPLPADMVKKVPLDFAIDHIALRNSSVKYQEIAASKISGGELYFRDLQADIHHLNKDSVLFNGPEPLQLKASAYLQGKSRISMHWSVPENGPPDHQQVHGQISNLELSNVNTILQTAAGITVEDGTLHDMHFQFTARPDTATGKVQMQYSGLKIALHKEEGYRRFKKRKMLSWFANGLIRRNNPSPLGRDITGRVAFRRDPRKSVFAYWWQSIFSGIKPIVFRKPVRKLMDRRR